MGNKNNPSRFDCYSKAEPDEPMFVLLGRDPAAPILINLWADIRSRMGEEQEKVEEAQACAEACMTWLVAHGKFEKFQAALVVAEEAMRDEAEGARIQVLEELVREMRKQLETWRSEVPHLLPRVDVLIKYSEEVVP